MGVIIGSCLIYNDGVNFPFNLYSLNYLIHYYIIAKLLLINKDKKGKLTPLL